MFDPLPPISTKEVCHVDDIPFITITNAEDETLTYLDPKDPGGDVDRLLAFLDGEHYDMISSLQDHDTYCHCIHQHIRKSKMSNNQLYKVENNTLKHHLRIDSQVFYPIILPHILIGHVLDWLIIN